MPGNTNRNSPPPQRQMCIRDRFGDGGIFSAGGNCGNVAKAADVMNRGRQITCRQKAKTDKDAKVGRKDVYKRQVIYPPESKVSNFRVMVFPA